MSNNQNSNDDAGIFQLDNGYWEYRYVIKVNGQRKDSRHTVDELGKGIIKLVSLKTRNARREIVMSTSLKEYLLQL